MSDQITIAMIAGWAVTVLSGLISGGLAGGFVGSISARSRQRTDIALSLIGQMFDMYTEIEDVSTRALKRDAPLTDADLSKLKKAGDWFEVVAAAYQGKVASSALLDRLNIPDQAVSFAAIVARAYAEKYLQRDLLSEWPHLKALRESKIRSGSCRDGRREAGRIQ